MHWEQLYEKLDKTIPLKEKSNFYIPRFSCAVQLYKC